MTIVGAILAAIGNSQKCLIRQINIIIPGFLAAAFSHHIALLYLFFGVVAGQIETARDIFHLSSIHTTTYYA